MEKIHDFQYSKMHNAAASQTYNHLGKHYRTIQQPFLERFVAEFTAANAAFSDVLRQPIFFAVTREMRPLERDRDRALTLLFRAVANGLRAADEPVRDAANALDVVLRRHRNPAALPQDEQSSVTAKLLRDLTSPATLPHLQKFPIAHAAALQIQELNNRFQALFNQRIAESKNRVIGLTERRRATADRAARNLARAINSYRDLIPDDRDLDAVIHAVNAILHEARLTLIRLRAARRRRDGKGDGSGVPAAGDAGSADAAPPRQSPPEASAEPSARPTADE